VIADQDPQLGTDLDQIALRISKLAPAPAPTVAPVFTGLLIALIIPCWAAITQFIGSLPHFELDTRQGLLPGEYFCNG
jgi:hypothetical protein